MRFMFTNRLFTSIWSELFKNQVCRLKFLFDITNNYRICCTTVFVIGLSLLCWRYRLKRKKKPVTVTISTKSTKILRGNSLVLNCTVHGETRPSAVLWTRSNGGPEENIQLTPDKHSGGTLEDPSLTVHNVTAEDSGTYVCKLMFDNDEVSSNSLTIHVEPVTVTISTKWTKILRGHSLVLHYTVNGETTPSAVLWTRSDGGPEETIQLTPDKHSGGTVDDPSLTVHNVTAEDSGTYVCKLMFDNDEVSSNSLTIHVEPVTVTISTKSTKILRGNSLVLNCTVHGETRPSAVLWTRSDGGPEENIQLTPDKHSGGTVNDPSLTVHKVTAEDSGTYVCKLMFDNDEVSSNSLTIHVEPVTVTISTKSTKILRGNSLVLNCTVHGETRPSAVLWTRSDGGPEETIQLTPDKHSGGTVDDPSLTVHNVTAEDSGTYVCKLMFDKDEVSSNSLTIHVEPVTVTISTKSTRILRGNSLVFHYTVNGETTPSAVLWTRSNGGPEENIQLTPDKHSGGTVDDPSLTVHNVTAEDSGTYVCKLMFENDEVSSNSLTVHVDIISDEEFNYWKLYLLCYKIGTESVRQFFHRRLPAPTLEAHLNTWQTRLDPGPTNRTRFKCHQTQFDLLFPAPPVKASSSTFDFTLLYKLIRNTFPLTYTWNQPLASLGNTEMDDLERIHIYRNNIAHNTDLKISNHDFKLQWKELSEAVSRLSLNTLQTEIEDLKKQTIDIRTRDELMEEMKTDLEYIRGEVDILQQEASDQRTKLGGHEAKLKEQDTKLQDLDIKIQDNDTRFNDHAAKLEKLESSVPNHIKNQAENTLKAWIESDKVFCPDTRAYKAVYDTVESSNITAIIGGPGTGKSATARHIALVYETKGWQVIPVISLDNVVDYADPTEKQVFVIDDLFGVYSADMSVYNMFNKCQDKLVNGQGQHFKLLLPSRKSVYNEVMGQCSSISVVDLDNEKLLYDENEKRKILVNHCKSANLSENVYNTLSLSTQFMFPFLCSQFVCSENYQKCGERFFTNPYECIIEELDRLKEHNDVQYAALVLCLLNNNEIKDVKRLPEKLKREVYDRCCNSTGTTSNAITNALNHLTGVYVTQIGNQFSFIHDSIQEIVGYHFGRGNTDLILKYMSCSFIWSKITVSKAMKNDDLCIEVGEEDYQTLAQRMYRDIKDKDSNQLFNVFNNKSVSYPLFVKTFMDIVKGLKCDELEELYNVYQVAVNEIEIKEKSRCNYLSIILNVTYTDGTLYYNTSIITWIVYNGHAEMLQTLLEYVKGKDQRYINKIFTYQSEQHRLLILACLSENINTVNVLLQWIDTSNINSTYNSNVNKYTPLTAACTTGNVDMIKFLVSCGADINLPNGYHMFPISVACEHGQLEAVKYFVEHGVKVNKDNRGGPLLHAASLKGHVDIISYLLDKEANIDLLDESSRSPLFWAASNGQTAAVSLLLDKGASIDLPDIDNYTPLFIATAMRNVDIVRLLIENKCSVNLTNNRGASPLYIAALNNEKEILQMLIIAGADLNMKTKEGLTPLMIALVSNNQKIVQILIKAENNKEQNTYQRVTDKPDKVIKTGNLHLFETIVDLRGSAIDDDDYNSLFYFKHADKYRLRCTRFAVFNVFDIVNFQTVCKNLIKFGWEVNKQNNTEDSPLLVCCKYLLEKDISWWEDIPGVIIMLIENCADPDYRNNNNEDVHDRVERWREIDRWKQSKPEIDWFESLDFNFRKTPRICKIRSVMDFLEVVSLVTKKVVRQGELDELYELNELDELDELDIFNELNELDALDIFNKLYKLDPTIKAIKGRVRRNSI